MRLKNSGGTLKGDMIFNRSGVETRAGMAPYSSIASIDIVNTTASQKQGGWLGRAVVGEVLLGPLGAVLGTMTRKNSTVNNVSFMVTLTSGQTLFTTAGAATFNEFFGLWQAKRHETGVRLAAFSGAGKFGSAGSNILQVAATVVFIYLMVLIFG